MPLLQISALWTRFCRLGRFSSPLLAMLLNLRSFLRPLLWTIKQSPPSIPLSLATLPPELLPEVLQYLDWDDVLRIRQVCRRLNDASFKRSVWLNIFLRHSMALPHLFRLEKPLVMHSSTELEKLILRWKAVDKRWSVDDAQPTLHRTFTVTDKSRSCSHLLRGGRWFLAGTIHGDVQYFDLDAPIITPRTLISAPFHHNFSRDLNTNTHIRIAVDLDHNSPTLAFNIAVLIARYDRDSSDLRYVQVWHVEPERNEFGQVTGLSSRQLSSFYEEADCDICHVSLFQETIAYSIRHFYPKPPRQDLVIVKWAEANGDDLTYRRRVITHKVVDWISLIPGNRIVCGRVRTELFDIDEIPETTLVPSNISSSQRNQCVMDLNVSSISQPFLVDGSTRFLFTTSGKIGGLVVHNGLPFRMEVKTLFKGSNHTVEAQLGYNHFVSFEEEQILTGGVCWGDHNIKEYMSIKKHRSYNQDERSFVDEISGRIVITKLRGDHHTVVEF
ncbi:hypothetical protein CPB83DRAFT_851976 [Crepidotus variabilis]|uniref:F-box domain-containing protein n=1 Tax=Crepidotus variabilis TaxID=179855 RepID=A0A9P6JRL9_9AGAR|nr:hypothetical protein CPB83DRAFT_851976 [Crepidotus variabilis]